MKNELTPLQVLERQHGFLLRHDNDEGFRRYVEGVFSSQMAWSDADEGRGEKYRKRTIEHFRNADAYRVRADMTDLVMFAAARLDDTDRIDSTLAPTPFGFVAFEKPLPIRDARGSEMLIHYLTWGPASHEYLSPLGRIVRAKGTWLTAWNDSVVEPDSVALQYEPRLRRLLGRYAFVGSETMIDGRQVGPAEMVLTPEMVERARKEDEIAMAEGREVPPLAGSYTNAGRYLHALWLLLGQTVTDVREEELSRGAQKMVGRMPIPGRVTVISLRRREGRKSEGETHVEWQHRWMVRGHWRWQPYADGTVQRIWINPYVKGPDDKPFVQSTRLYSLDH